MKITKATVKEVIQYLKKTRENTWCVGDQSNEKGQHCAIGQISCKPSSPFFRKSTVYVSEYGPEKRLYTRNGALGDTLQCLCQDKLGVSLAAANNGCSPRYSQPTPRERSIAILKDLLKVM